MSWLDRIEAWAVVGFAVSVVCLMVSIAWDQFNVWRRKP